LLPVTNEDIAGALQSLKIGPLLGGYRGKPAAGIAAIVDAVQSVCRYVEANSDGLLELEINPLIARRHDAVAVDALISLREN
jgi:acetate---CoA ligase (ADP-forming)